MATKHGWVRIACAVHTGQNKRVIQIEVGEGGGGSRPFIQMEMEPKDFAESLTSHIDRPCTFEFLTEDVLARPHVRDAAYAAKHGLPHRGGGSEGRSLCGGPITGRDILAKDARLMSPGERAQFNVCKACCDIVDSKKR